MLTNVRPEHRSKLSFIQLIAVAKTSVIRKTGQIGLSKLLANFIDGLVKLAEGHAFNIKGEIKVMTGALLAFVGCLQRRVFAVYYW